jgi:hypothetical protein
MKTFFKAKFALFPLAVFITLIAYVSPTIAVTAGFAVALIVCAWRLYSGHIKNFEVAVLAVFTALATGVFIAPGLVGPVAISLAFVGFSTYALASVVLRRPWTSEFSSAAYPQAGASPLFIRINMILSALWAVLFLLLALAHMLSAGIVVTYGIVVAGALASIFGPRILGTRWRHSA